ncbi:helix-turn-helix domain-containing protein [Nocardioides limicola]|uniref:helix-turn-helix domain-containing protein n=1 Tax=Nocardioides limicola TaxID=2803368 RepID=UPI00193BC381|nr:helix-turn-helix domain-containing protein [Nocardioides sp. DJM-14]
MLTNVAVPVYDGVTPFELGVLCEAFGLDRSDQGVPTLDFAVCGAAPTARTTGGFSITVDHDLARMVEADLIAIPAIPRDRHIPPSVVDAVRAAFDRGARVLTVCSGAFVAGAAGLLDDRECTTHWLYTDELAARFPRATVIPEVLYVDAGQVVTSAGTAAGIDASLHIWRQEYGADIASTIARRMVIPPQRDGGQAQFITRPVPECHAETLGPLLAWVTENLDQPLDVTTLAARALMSSRTFARRFRDEVGSTPHAWITHQRVIRAEQLLERSDHSVDRIARDVGFGNAATLRHHFTRLRGLSPQAYRRSFAH